MMKCPEIFIRGDLLLQAWQRLRALAKSEENGIRKWSQYQGWSEIVGWLEWVRLSLEVIYCHWSNRDSKNIESCKLFVLFIRAISFSGKDKNLITQISILNTKCLSIWSLYHASLIISYSKYFLFCGWAILDHLLACLQNESAQHT